MAAADSPDVTLALVDTSILSCWKEKVKQSHECSLLLTHSKGKVFTTLKCSMVIKSPEARENCHLAPQAEEKRNQRRTRGERRRGWSLSLLSINAWWTRGDCLQVDSCLNKLLKYNLPTIARGLKGLRPCGTACWTIL